MSGEEGESGSVLGWLARRAGRRVAAAERAFRTGQETAALPADEEGRLRIVCRRYAERRTVPVDDTGRPACYDPDSPDCQGCVEDIRAGRIETWDPD